MKSIAQLGTSPAGLPIVSEDLLELHAARILLLCRVCGIKNKVDGLTKLAKLDFFVRYPEFFHQVSTYLGHPMMPVATTRESGMVRFHYGPWDKQGYGYVVMPRTHGGVVFGRATDLGIRWLRRFGREVGSYEEQEQEREEPCHKALLCKLCAVYFCAS